MWRQGEKWVKQAAELGHVPAMFYFGYIMESNYADIEAAKHWYLKASDLGDAQASFKLGTL
jgi:TPR repeat protein